MNSERVLIFVLLTAVSAVVGCADLSRGQALPDSAPATVQDAAAVDFAGPTDARAALSFAVDVHHLVVDGCARCHSSGGSANTSAFILVNDATKDRQEVLMFVNLSNPAGSRLVAKGAGSGHGGGAIYAASTPEYRTIVNWISQGGLP